MKKIGLLIGKIAFWLSFPALWIWLRRSARTRVLIIFNDEFLVLQDWLSAGDWSLPGGGLHKGENSLQGLIREVQEETGIELYEKDVMFLFNTHHNERGIPFTYDCFAAQLDTKPEVKLQKFEIADYKWVSLKNPDVRLSKDTTYALEQWQNKG